MAIMDTTVVFALICTFAVLNLRDLASAQEEDKEHCFTFNGTSYLVFVPSVPFNNSNRVHYEFSFKTSTQNGVIMYARGPNGDREALFVRDGKLHYHLFNTGRGGVGRQFGGDFVSEERVDNNQWIEAHIYRSWTPDSIARRVRPAMAKTGIEFILGGSTRTYVDYLAREHIEISPTIYFGGYMSALSSSVGNFTGKIRGIKEHSNGHTFDYPSQNYRSRVELQC